MSGTHHFLSWHTLVLHYVDISSFIYTHRSITYAGFMLLYICVVAFSLPIASLLTLAAGAFLGWPAIGFIVVAATLGASIVFSAARSVLKDVLEVRAGTFLKKFGYGFTKNAFSYLLFLRLLPIAPFWAVNILPAFTSMSLNHFVIATLIGIIPGTTVYVAVGRGFNYLLRNGEVPNLSLLKDAEIWLPLTGLALLALLPILYQNIKDTLQKRTP